MADHHLPVHAITEYHTLRNWAISQDGIVFLSVKDDGSSVYFYRYMRIHKLKEDRRGNSHVSIQPNIKVNTKPEREGIWGWSTGAAVEMHPENMAVDALCSWISWGGDRSILEGSGASEVGTLEETSPACHFHMHFIRMEDPFPFPLTLDDSHNNNKGSWGLCGILLLSSWGADQCRDMDTDSLPLASVWQNNIPQVIWRKVLSKVLRKEWLLLEHCQNTDLWWPWSFFQQYKLGLQPSKKSLEILPALDGKAQD